ncbi:hypothetical protein EPUL_000275, partial [Erysiphe pulchra]
MALIATVTATASTVITGMYLEGKLSLYKDLTSWYNLRKANQLFLKAGESKTISNCNGRLFVNSDKKPRIIAFPCIQPNDLVAFCLTNSPDLLFAWLGLWSIGAAPAMINHNLTGNSLLHTLKLSGAKTLLVDRDEDVKLRIEQSKEQIIGELGMKIVLLGDELRQEINKIEAKRPDDLYRLGVKDESPVAMFYTSGTTGFPKGVLFKINRAHRVIFRFLEPEDRWYVCMPLYHATGAVIAFSALTTGNTLAIGKKFSTSKFWREIHDSQSTWICYVGEIARYLLAVPPSSLDSTHKVKGMFGNGLRPDVWIKFRDRFQIDTIVEFFSSSEGVLSLVNVCRGDYLAKAVGHHGALARFATRNTIVPVMVDDATGEILRDTKSGFAIRQPYHIGGEIIVKVNNTEEFAGYHGDRKATEKKFARDVFQKGDLWYRSGDSLKRTPDGRWFFLDRLGDTFRWKGENVSTAEVAEILGQYPGIIEANVFGVSIPGHDGKVGCAAIYIDPTLKQNFDFADFLRHARSLLPQYAVPVFLRLVKEVTLTHNFKQNKVSLKAEGIDPAKVKNGDVILWIENNGKGLNYQKFLQNDWVKIQKN